VIRDEGRHADPEVDGEAIAELLDRPFDDAFAIEHVEKLSVNSYQLSVESPGTGPKRKLTTDN
jgi:hypothetical protein